MKNRERERRERKKEKDIRDIGVRDNNKGGKKRLKIELKCIQKD